MLNRRQIIHALAILTILISGATQYASGQVPNDNYLGAATINLQVAGNGIAINGNIAFSTPSFYTGGSCIDPADNDLWYRFAAVTDQVQLTYSNTADFEFIIYREVNGVPIEMDCHPAELEVIPNEFYYIRVVGENLPTDQQFWFVAEYVLPLDPSTLEPNDSCHQALPIVVGSGMCGPTYAFDADSITASDIAGLCYGQLADLWYTFDAPASGSVMLTSVSGTSKFYSVFSDDCDAPDQIACTATGLFIGLTPGETYLLRVAANTGMHAFCVEDAPPVHSNNDCATASALTVSTTPDTFDIDWTYTLASDETLCDDEVEDVWYAFTGPSQGNITVERISGFYNWSIYEGTCGSLSSVICDQAYTDEYLTNLATGNSYLLRITKSFSSSPVTFSIRSAVPPVNDDCSGAIPLSISGSCTSPDTLDMIGTTFSGISSPCFNIAGDAWYTFVAPGNGAVHFYTLTADKTIYSGTCGSLTPVTCDVGNDVQGLTPGQTYYLQLSQAEPSSDYTFCLTTNTEATGGNNTCGTADVIAEGVTFSVDFATAAFESGSPGSCAYHPQDLWYTFSTGPDAQTFELQKLSFQPASYTLYEGSCGTLTELACHDFSGSSNQRHLVAGLSPNTDYYVQLYYGSTISGMDFVFDLFDPAVNDDCTGAIPVSVLSSCMNTNIDFDETTMSSVALPACLSSSFGYTDMWFAVDPGVYEVFEFENTSVGSSQLSDMSVVLYDQSCGSLVELDCRYNLPQGSVQLFDGLTSGQTYYLRIVSNEPDNGRFCLSGILPPENDLCENAIPLSIGDGQCIGTTPIGFNSATDSDVDGSCAPGTYKDLWYALETTEAGEYLLQKFAGSTAYATLYAGTCTGLTELYCAQMTSNSQLLFENLAAGTTYYLQISGSSSNQSQICVSYLGEEAGASDCGDAAPIAVSMDQACTQSVSGTTLGAGTSGGQFCTGNQAQAIFYHLNIDSSAYYNIELDNFTNSLRMAVFEDCTLSTPRACAVESLSTILDVGQSYILAVYPAIPGQHSGFDLCVYPAAIDTSANVGVNLQNPQTTLDVNGGIKPGNSMTQIPGNIRWAGDLEVYDGAFWKSLTDWDHEADQDIQMQNFRIRGLNTPSLDSDAATKGYVDAQSDGDGDPLNEIQTISKSGNTVTLSDGGGSFIDENTTYDASDFVPSNQGCPAGQVLTGFTAAGTPICASADDADSNPTNEIQTLSKTGNTITLSNGGGSVTDAVDDADSNPSNELQTISKTGNTVTLSSGGGSFTDDVDDADNDPANEIETWSTLSGIPAGFADDKDDINDPDSDPTNELQTISKIGSTVTLSDGGGSFTDDVDDADNDPSNEIETWSTLSGKPADFADGTDDVDDADSNPTNELQSISKSGTTITLSNGGGSIEDAGLFEYYNGVVRSTGSTDDDFVFGMDSLPENGTFYLENLLFYDESKGALRAGALDNSFNWAPDSIGDYSFAAGRNTKAKGDHSVALGWASFATGDYSVAMGLQSMATGSTSFAVGQSALASGSNAFATGFVTQANGSQAFATGSLTQANGQGAFAQGRSTQADAQYASAFGKYNVGGGSPNTWVDTDPVFEIGIGSLITPTNALTVLKNGTVSFKEYTFPNTDGALGQVLATDGSGSLIWEDEVGVFENVSGVVRNTGSNSEDFVFGSDQLPSGSFADTLFFFDQTKGGAFRAGQPGGGDRWSPANIGSLSFAAGLATQASGAYSVAFGNSTDANGSSAFAAGALTNATGNASVAFGGFSTASGDYAVATGFLVNASGDYAFATGQLTDASGDHSTATGGSTSADGNYSFATGLETDANAYASVALGRYNIGDGNATNWIGTDPVFEIGMGSSSVSRANAMTVLKNGTVSFKDYTFPLYDGMAGQVLATDGSGTLQWQSDQVGRFAENNGVVYNTGSEHDDFVFGLDSLPVDGIEHQATLYFFDHSKAAFRAGRVWSSESWNTEWLGVSSFATGWNTKASGNFSVATGQHTEATGWASFAAGNFASAPGLIAFALGNFTEANAANSMAVGIYTKAEAFASMALGRYNIGGGNDTSWIDSDPIFEIGNGTGTGVDASNALTVLKNGRTGIGTHTPDEALSVVGLVRGVYEEDEADFIEIGHGGNNAFINADGAGNLDIRHHDANIMTLTQSQKVGIRTNSPDTDLHIKHINSGSSGGLKLENVVTGEWARFYVSSSSGYLRIYMDSVGIIGSFDDVSGAYNATSDRRLKEGFRDLHFDWESFSKLKPLTYAYKTDKSHRQHVGMVAQDVMEIYPEIVSYDRDTDRYLMDYSAFGVVAVKAIQEQQKTIGQLSSALAEKDSEIQALSSRLDRMEAVLAKLSEDE